MGTRRFRVSFVASLLMLGTASLPLRAQDMAEYALLLVLIASNQVTPPVLTSSASGVAFLTFHREKSMLCYLISYRDGGLSDLRSGETAANFRGPARPGEYAKIEFRISPRPSSTGSPKAGCVGPLNAEQRRDLLRGLWYINIQSNKFPKGEMRGQIRFSERGF